MKVGDRVEILKPLYGKKVRVGTIVEIYECFVRIKPDNDNQILLATEIQPYIKNGEA